MNIKNKKLSHIKYGLQTRLNIYFFIIIFFLMLIITLFSIRLEQKSIYEQMQKDGIALARSYTLSVENALLLKGAGLSRITGEASRTKGIYFLQILDTTYTIIGHTDISQIGAKVYDTLYEKALKTPITALEEGKTPIIRMKMSLKQEKIFCVIMPLVTLSKVIGILEIGLETNAISEVIKKTNQQFIIISCVTIVLGIIFIWIFARSIVKPIQRLSYESQKVASGDLSAEIISNAKDEIGELYNSFNFMRKKLKEYLEDLKNTNLQLKLNIELTERLRFYIENIINSISLGIITIDLDKKVTYLNNIGKKILNLKNIEVIGKVFTDVFNKEHFLADAFNKLINTSQTIDSCDIKITDNESKEIIIHLKTALLYDSDGKILGYMAIFEDVTEIRVLQKRIQQTDKITAIGRLSMGIAHEVRNPLSAIKTCAQFLEKSFEIENKDQKPFAQLIIREAERLDGLIARLLNYAKPAEKDFQYINVNDTIINCISLAGLKAKQLKISIIQDISKDLPHIFADANRLSQAILNLLLNAIEAIKENGVITLKTYFDSNSGKIFIVVKDTGKGIPKEEQEKIFDPFYSTRPGGNGLGLAIAQQIIFEHNGTIRVESEINKGTTFTISLPIKQWENQREIQNIFT